jgi:hypothetical protein
MKAIFAALALLAMSVCGMAEEAPVPKHLQLARELLATVKPENNFYNATRTQTGITWADEAPGQENKVNTMCTEFVGGLLKKANDPVFVLLKTQTKQTKLLHTDNFVEAYEKGFFTAVKSLSDVKPGDLFIMQCKDGCATATGISAQGHIAVVDSVPTKSKNSLGSDAEWKLTVIDSDDVLHDQDDTRNGGAFHAKRTGVGRGSYVIYTDKEGVPTGYADGIRSHYSNATARPIVFARLKQD